MKKLLLLVVLFFASSIQSQNKIVSSLSEQYEDGAYIVSGGYNYTYDTNNNLLSETYYFFYDDVWTTYDKNVYTYNANNKAVTQTYQNFENNQFVNNYRSNYTYNASNKLITILDQDWDGTSWTSQAKTDITYNGNLFLNVITKQWDGTQYVNDYKSTPTYTGTNATEWLNQLWDGTMWVTSSKTILTYNTNNKITNYKTQTWNGSVWEDEENFVYTLATNGNRLSQVNSLFGELDGQRDYTYDSTASMSNFGNPFKDKTGIDYVFQDFPYVNKILNEVDSYYDTNTSSFTLGSRTTYNYTDSLPLSRKDFQTNKISIYPNPATTIIALSGLTSSEKVTIYNLLGSKVYEGSIAENKNINVENLPSGLYFLSFENGTSLKFLKK